MKIFFLMALLAVGIFAASGCVHSAPVLTTQPAAMSMAELIDPTTHKPRIPHPKPLLGATLSMGILELGNFPFDPEEDTTVPADVMALDGVRLTTTGFIIPLTNADPITDFALVSPSTSVGAIYAGWARIPGPEHLLICHANNSEGIADTGQLMTVTGVLTVKLERQEGYTSGIFKRFFRE